MTAPKAKAPRKKPEVVTKPSKGLATYGEAKEPTSVTMRAYLMDGSYLIVGNYDGGLPGAREAAEAVFRKGYVELVWSGEEADFIPVTSIRKFSVRLL